MKHVSDNYKHYPGAKKNLYCVVGFVLPSVCSGHKIEAQKDQESCLDHAGHSSSCFSRPPGTFKTPSSYPGTGAQTHK